jgi:hypothetical protein
MSSFDSIIVSCVDCDKLNTIQSKAGKCEMKKYNQTHVPMAIAQDLLGTKFNCHSCNFENVIGGTHPTHVSLFTYQPEGLNYDDDD